MDSNQRFQLLELYGYPGPLAFATGLERYFPYIYSNEDGYWAYVIKTPMLPFLPPILFFAGDPVCHPENRSRFVAAAVEALGQKGIVAALQVHRPVAQAFMALGQGAYAAHQLGVETQVPLPIQLSGQIGNKVRQAVKAGLKVEELVFRAEDAGAAAPAKEQAGQQVTIRKKTVHTNTNRRENELIINANGNLQSESSRLLRQIDELLQVTECEELEEYRRKVERLRLGKIPPGIDFYICPIEGNNGQALASFGYYQPTGRGYNKHDFAAIPVPRVEPGTDSFLKPGKQLIAERDLEDIQSISASWLAQQLNSKEMGPPLLKPFSREDEPGRRLFVTRDPHGRVIAFADFDPVNRLSKDGGMDRQQKGFYANMIRTVAFEAPNDNKSYKYASQLLLAAAAVRFYEEGYQVLTLGLNPLGCIYESSTLRKEDSAKGLTWIENIFYWIANSRLMNTTTYAYRGVMRTKQQNWPNREDIPTYVVFNGNAIEQLHQMVNGFIVTGAVGGHVAKNLLNLFKRRRGRASEPG